MAGFASTTETVPAGRAVSRYVGGVAICLEAGLRGKGERVSAGTPSSGVGVVRWTFKDTKTGETAVFYFNPHEATSPSFPRDFMYAWGSASGPDRIRVMERPLSNPPQWTFTGHVYSVEHYAFMLTWAERDTILRVTDHVGRTFETMIQKFEMIEKRPTATRPIRGTYSITCLLLREI